MPKERRKPGFMGNTMWSQGMHLSPYNASSGRSLDRGGQLRPEVAEAASRGAEHIVWRWRCHMYMSSW